MNNLSTPLTFSVILGSSAHHLGEHFSRQQSNPEKAKQVYLNTLAVSAVKFYLDCMGLNTSWEASHSYSPVMQTLMDVGDLDVVGLGKLECRPVLPEAEFVRIAPEVQLDRIGYVAVQMDKSLKKAQLLGFVKTAATDELPISQLRSLTELLAHLDHLRQSASIQQVNLSQWWQNWFAAGWQSLETLLAANPGNLAFSFRSNSPLSQTGVQGAKLIDLGLQLGSQTVALLVAIAPTANDNVDIRVQVHPVGREIALPPLLKLSLLSKSGEMLQAVESRSQDNYIQLKQFRGKPGEGFNIQVALDQAIVTEKFVI